MSDLVEKLKTHLRGNDQKLVMPLKTNGDRFTLAVVTITDPNKSIELLEGLNGIKINYSDFKILNNYGKPKTLEDFFEGMEENMFTHEGDKEKAVAMSIGFISRIRNDFDAYFRPIETKKE